MINRPQPSQANAFRFRRARRLFFGLAAVFIPVLCFSREVVRLAIAIAIGSGISGGYLGRFEAMFNKPEL
jgi:hypothetical protein